MIRIKTPATSANLSVGFDTVGIAFNLYNIFSFKEASENRLIGFPKLFSDENNLVLSSYMKFALKYLDKKNICLVEITLEENMIPESRGLGSSASCILAGVFASNHLNNLNRSFKECVAFACELEGHSDNVYACAYGYLTASLKHDRGYINATYPVNEKLSFNLMIPKVTGSTKQLRDILPKRVDFSDAVYNLSRIVFLPEAFLKGNLEKLKIILSDKLHETYRYPYIPKYEEVKALGKRTDLVVCLSGSGPSVLLITTKQDLKIPDSLIEVYDLKKVELSKGLKIEVV